MGTSEGKWVCILTGTIGQSSRPGLCHCTRSCRTNALAALQPAGAVEFPMSLPDYRGTAFGTGEIAQKPLGKAQALARQEHPATLKIMNPIIQSTPAKASRPRLRDYRSAVPGRRRSHGWPTHGCTSKNSNQRLHPIACQHRNLIKPRAEHHRCLSHFYFPFSSLAILSVSLLVKAPVMCAFPSVMPSLINGAINTLPSKMMANFLPALAVVKSLSALAPAGADLTV
jgi:hypothetical protein